MAGTGTGLFSSIEEGSGRMVSLEHSFDPDPARGAQYGERYAKYLRLWPLLKELLVRPLSAAG
jgi:hypothetical protein